ncbi:MAG: S41 family peptidase [Myxococcales bacterium]|nr:S41 family peptidase [Myxococcales bacterium]
MSRLAPWLLVVAGCLGPGPDTSPPALFDHLWTDFDERYGQFSVKDVDWEASYDTIRPRFEADPSDQEMSEAFKDLLRPLGDGHVILRTFLEDEIWKSYTPTREKGDVDLDLIENEILTDPGTQPGDLLWGRLSDRVGYVHLHHMDLSKPQRSLATALDALGDVDGLVVDVRDNGGGSDQESAAYAGCFAQQTTPFLTIRIRNGPNHDDFTDPMHMNIEPAERCAFEGPVVLITNQFSLSAAETFTLGMVELPQVTHIGERTQGAFSDAIFRELGNGWLYSISIGDWRDAHDVSH